jgi:hypothetical protein
MLSIFRRKTTAQTPEQIFWNWFVQNKEFLEKFIDSANRDYSIYRKLTEKIKTYNSILFAELTKTESGQYILVITPDGLKDGVEPTKRLAEARPEIENWIIQKFRQPSKELTLNFQGLQYPQSDIQIFAQLDREKEVVDIEVFIPNMNQEPKKYQHLTFLYFDHILGEFNTIMKIGTIQFHHIEPNQEIEGSINLVQLREFIAQELY